MGRTPQKIAAEALGFHDREIHAVLRRTASFRTAPDPKVAIILPPGQSLILFLI